MDDIDSHTQEQKSADKKRSTHLVRAVYILLTVCLVALVAYVTATELLQGHANVRNTASISEVKLTGQASTTRGLREDNTSNFPIFKVSFPNTWTKLNDELSDDTETLTLQNEQGTRVVIRTGSDVDQMPLPSDMQELSSAQFSAAALPDGYTNDMGPMIVARGYDSQNHTWVYALVPASYVDEDTTEDSLSLSFDVGVAISVSCTSSSALDRQTESEIAAIIASFVVDESVVQTQDSDAETTVEAAAVMPADVDSLKDDHVLPNSSSNYIKHEELLGMSDWELALARAEIYARHGYSFKDENLRNYFAEQGWYTPLFPMGDTAEVDQEFSDVERYNIGIISDYEQEIGSKYQGIQ